jgi:cobalamin biosynthesis protein CobT
MVTTKKTKNVKKNEKNTCVALVIDSSGSIEKKLNMLTF